MFIYNPASNTWTRGTDLPVARAEGISAVVDRKIYLIGGRVRATEDARLFNDHIDTVRNEVFDPTTQRWSIRANAPTPRNSAASAVIDRKIYVVGGRQFVKNADGTTRQVNVPNLEVYDPKLDRWETRSPMPQARGGLAATSLNGKLYVFGGEQWVPEQKVFAESWVYDPKTNDWEALPPLPTPRHGLGASAVGNRIFVFGGGTKTGGNAATAIHEVLVLPTQ
jgi:N-acetylneuraminic acid mutarotase